MRLSWCGFLRYKCLGRLASFYEGVMMLFFKAFSLVFLVFLTMPLLTLAEPVLSHCGAPTASESAVHLEDFAWDQTLPEMKERFEHIYQSGKRLEGRAYWDSAQNSIVMPNYDGMVRLPIAFIDRITKHIENILRHRYADFVFYSDLGHNHFLISEERWKELAKLSRHNLFETLIASPDLKVLYHLSEQLKILEGPSENPLFPSDQVLLFRYFNRNAIGDNVTGETLDVQFAWDEKYNTYRGSPVEHYSAGFNLSASKEGCFPYQHNGQTYYFDIAINDPSPLGGGI